MEKIFDNTADAFVLKSDTELDRAYFLFRMIASEPLVKIGTAVTNFALKIHLPVEGLIRATVFDHFCGGTTEEDCLPVVEQVSGLRAGVDFKYGYSPERINPGDTVHTLENVVKVVSGNDAGALEEIAKTYELVVNNNSDVTNILSFIAVPNIPQFFLFPETLS